LQLIEQGKDLPEILSMLCDNYDGDEQMIEKDVLDFTDELKSNNIINV
jgi:hypothetical protein